jgi:hypothetical protein
MAEVECLQQTAEKRWGRGRKPVEVNQIFAGIPKLPKIALLNGNRFGAHEKQKTDQRRITLLNGRFAWVNGTEQS